MPATIWERGITPRVTAESGCTIPSTVRTTAGSYQWRTEPSNGSTLKRATDSSPSTVESRTFSFTTPPLRWADTRFLRRARRSSSKLAPETRDPRPSRFSWQSSEAPPPHWQAASPDNAARFAGRRSSIPGPDFRRRFAPGDHSLHSQGQSARIVWLSFVGSAKVFEAFTRSGRYEKHT